MLVNRGFGWCSGEVTAGGEVTEVAKSHNVMHRAEALMSTAKCVSPLVAR
jgi:hypothetical protein